MYHVSFKPQNRIDIDMDSTLALSAIDRGFKPKSGKTKIYNIGICCFSAKNAALMSKSKDLFAQNRDQCVRVTCLPAHCCISDLAI